MPGLSAKTETAVEEFSAAEADVEESSVHAATRQPQEQEVKDEDITCCAYVCYTFLAFFAYWFGAARFDQDGDGDFDAADVQAMIDGGSKKLMLNFTRPPQDQRAKAQRRERAQRRRAQHEAERQSKRRESARLHEEHLRAHREAGGVSGAAGLAVERAMHGVVVHAWPAGGVLEADVESEAQEEEILDNLRQAVPCFCIVEVLLCLVLWGATAPRARSYAPLAYGVGVADGGVLATHAKDGGTTLLLAECEAECDGAGAACLGIAWLPGPSPQCRLLERLPASASSSVLCPRSAWDWRVYKKDAWSLGASLGQMGGAESIWPGRTSLKAHHNCEHGYDISFLWRWWSYQFTHGSISHMFVNCFMILVLGVPLEGWQGTGMIAVMWTLGCLGGACCWALFDPYRETIGASGGCYSMLGMHIADLVMNWGDKKWRFGTLFTLSLVCSVDLAYFYATYDPDGGAASNVVHVGGLIAGILIVMTSGRNMHRKWWETVFSCIAWVLGIGLLAGTLFFWYGANNHPAIANLWDSSQRPWCWIGEVCIGDDGAHCPLLDTPPTFTTGATTAHETRRQCVFCTTRACVEGWYSSYIADDGTEHYKYCPTESAQSTCGDEFTDSWDLFYPPTRSKYQS
ncbi:unnamed protein product [Prorocentrum cordatum]|uniref:Peptidase S54 rhomboid domain-containing protein n=1 Tax=Prorocentrum cordatum TaxID=2364126 RepID=A0ABN9XP29_9DINO|nr:unnamed protein product [Polarella glacialis]CAK0901677.1 unnamed protein product [Polarella glacialis]